MKLETAIIPGVEPCPLSPRQVAREFDALLQAGAALKPAGLAKRRPRELLRQGYAPRFKIELFDTALYLSGLREDENFRFFVAWLRPQRRDGARSERTLHPRIVYKDSSLVWRSATHVIRSPDENWIGKGAVRFIAANGDEIGHSVEETTNLPLEMQAALDDVSRRGRVVRDEQAAVRVLRNAPDHRIEPYADFTSPRERAMSDRRNLVNGGLPIARFTRSGDPASLRFTKGFEPDFAGGRIDESRSRSRLYGGGIRKIRFLSQNRRIQYQFIAGPHHAWIIPPQTLTTELSSYGVRTVDVVAPEDLCVPGYEYHYLDTTCDPPQLHTQIPDGFAGPASEVDPSRADASPWLERLPVIREFRRRVLERG